MEAIKQEQLKKARFKFRYSSEPPEIIFQGFSPLEEHVQGKKIISHTFWLQYCHLVDLVHHPEGTAVELLQGHEIEHGGDAALSSALAGRRQLVQVSVAVKLHLDSDSVLVVILLEESALHQ